MRGAGARVGAAAAAAAAAGGGGSGGDGCSAGADAAPAEEGLATAGANVGWVGSNPGEAAAYFQRHGMLRVRKLLSEDTCSEMRRHIDELLAKTGGGEQCPERFGDVNTKRCRWDMFLRLNPTVLKALREALGPTLPLWQTLLEEEPQLCELSSLISDPGSERQPLHSDTSQEAGVSSLVTCFIALQDISPDMGPTIMLPRTHSNPKAHRHLAYVCEPELGGLPGPTADIGGLELPVVHCAVSAGDAVLMDSRLLHCGGANISTARRRLMYFTVHERGVEPRGSTYSMLLGYRDALALSELEQWGDH